MGFTIKFNFQQIRIERSCYLYRIEKAIRYKDTLSMVVDGSEFSKYGLPYFCVQDKETTDGWKVPTRMYGSIVHGEFASAYIYPAHLPGGSNVTIEVIHRFGIYCISRRLSFKSVMNRSIIFTLFNFNDRLGPLTNIYMEMLQMESHQRSCRRYSICNLITLPSESYSLLV
jgi:hypothetical protein